MTNKIECLTDLAGKIKNPDLRKKVVDLLKNPKPSNKNFTQGVTLQDAPASESWHHTDKGGLIIHIESVTKMCIAVAEVFEKQYNLKLDMDTLVASALCHDIMKTSEMEDIGEVSVMKAPMYLDHLTLGIAELYSRGFPAKVVHLIAAHHGEGGPVAPSETEAVILHFVDSIDSYANTEKSAGVQLGRPPRGGIEW